MSLQSQKDVKRPALNIRSRFCHCCSLNLSERIDFLALNFPSLSWAYQLPITLMDLCVDIHRFSRFEGMHRFSLSTSKLLKDCVTGFLKDESRFSSVMNTFKGSAKLLSHMLRTTLSTVHGFLQLVRKSSPSTAWEHISNEESAGRLTGFCDKPGIVGMLKTIWLWSPRHGVSFS